VSVYHGCDYTKVFPLKGGSFHYILIGGGKICFAAVAILSLVSNLSIKVASVSYKRPGNVR
jgi:hypothetical protein